VEIKQMPEENISLSTHTLVTPTGVPYVTDRSELDGIQEALEKQANDVDDCFTVTVTFERFLSTELDGDDMISRHGTTNLAAALVTQVRDELQYAMDTGVMDGTYSVKKIEFVSKKDSTPIEIMADDLLMPGKRYFD
jgi:hypothetical protein